MVRLYDKSINCPNAAIMSLHKRIFEYRYDTLASVFHLNYCNYSQMGDIVYRNIVY